MTEGRYQLDHLRVRQFLAHRFPFLLVDRILEIQPPVDTRELAAAERIGTKVVGIKNVTINEPFFTGHFPQYPIKPGVLLLETMAQVSAFTLYPHVEDNPGSFVEKYQYILTGVNDARFRKPVLPGDTLRVEGELLKVKGPLWIFKTQCMVEGKKVAEAELMANLIPLRSS